MAPPFPPSGSSQLNKHFAVSPPLVSEIFSAPSSVRINGEILKRPNGEYFGSGSNNRA